MSRRRALVALPLAAVAYVLAAWSVAPGFYDGIGPSSPYRWVSPPPTLAAGNQQPLSGESTDPVLGGSTAPLTVYTGDGQCVISFLPASFRVSSGQQAVAIKITPERDFPPAAGFRPGTNVYLVSADAPLVKPALVELQYSNAVPAPSYLYRAPPTGGAWTNIGASQVSAVFSIAQRSSQLGYFAAGYPSSAKAPAGSPTVGGGQVVPIIVAGLILLALVAGVPLALMRRGGEEEESESEDAADGGTEGG